MFKRKKEEPTDAPHAKPTAPVESELPQGIEDKDLDPAIKADLDRHAEFVAAANAKPAGIDSEAALMEFGVPHTKAGELQALVDASREAELPHVIDDKDLEAAITADIVANAKIIGHSMACASVQELLLEYEKRIRDGADLKLNDIRALQRAVATLRPDEAP